MASLDSADRMLDNLSDQALPYVNPAAAQFRAKNLDTGEVLRVGSGRLEKVQAPLTLLPPRPTPPGSSSIALGQTVRMSPRTGGSVAGSPEGGHSLDGQSFARSPSSAMAFSPGDVVNYRAADGDLQQAEVLKIHQQDGLGPYYTIKLAGGHERQTEGARLSPLLSSPCSAPVAGSSRCEDGSPHATSKSRPIGGHGRGTSSPPASARHLAFAASSAHTSDAGSPPSSVDLSPPQGSRKQRAPSASASPAPRTARGPAASASGFATASVASATASVASAAAKVKGVAKSVAKGAGGPEAAEVKVVMLGRSGVGKTSLLYRWSTREFLQVGARVLLSPSESFGCLWMPSDSI